MLDFDGTLAPIVPNPPDARIPGETLSALRSLRACAGVEMAIVSGRSASDARGLAGLGGITYFGSHGRERIDPEGRLAKVEGSGREAIQSVCERLSAELGGVPGFVVENKGVSAAAHYRNVDARDRDRVAPAVLAAVAASGRLEVSPGKMVYDITPADGVDKGSAAMALLSEFGGVPLYFGDDTTDENAFRTLPSSAVTVYVGPADNQSRARFRVSDPAEVGESLSRILCVVRHRR